MSGAESKFIKIDPAYQYRFNNYLKLNISRGDFYVELLLYDASFMNIANLTLNTYSSGNNEFKKENYSVPLSGYPNAKYGRIQYRWWNATQTPEGTVWIDDIFFGPVVTCKGSGNSYTCGEISITKISGNGDLYPFTDSNEIISNNYAYLKDSNCISGLCSYLVCSPDLCTYISCG